MGGFDPGTRWRCPVGREELIVTVFVLIDDLLAEWRVDPARVGSDAVARFHPWQATRC